MPKETVQFPRPSREVQTKVTVEWLRDGDVNIVVGPLPEGGSKWFCSEELTRHEINKMIRVLRKARDQAFGRDE